MVHRFVVVSIFLLALTACGGGSSSSAGGKAPISWPPSVEAAVAILAAEDQEYVREHLDDVRLIADFADGCGVHIFTGTVNCGCAEWTGWPTIEDQGAVLVHEACHVDNQHGLAVANEVQCIEAAAAAMDRIGATDQAARWRSFDGTHVLEAGASC